MDILDDHHSDEIDPNVKGYESAGTGTTKRKELHGTIRLDALSGTWRDNPHGAVFHVYKIDFSCDIESYPGFVLLTESKLDDDVANAKVDLYLLDKTAKSSVIPCGEVHLGSDQIKRAMRFHELLFNGLYGKLFQGSKASGVNREFLLQRDNNLLWSTSFIYLILPLEPPNMVDHDSWRINWKGIDSCVSVVEFMRNSAWLSAEQSGAKYRSSIGDSSVADCTAEGTIHLANHSLSIEKLEETVVMSIHTGRIYYVREVLVNTSAESPFDSNVNGAPSKYSSFADYFKKKYGIVLFYPEQPLLLLKQTHNPFNLLSDSEASELRRKMLSSGDLVDAKRNNHVNMPPELLVRIDIKLSALRALYLIPSLIHRLESIMLACQLRKEISYKFPMPSSLILEALTTLRCCEDFSSERLELLGDSVLKYAVSCHVFLKYPQKHEGKLSGQRQSIICNANLHKLGTNCKLQEYIRDSAFEPRRWVAPGQLSVHPVPCSHSVDTSEVPLESTYHTFDETVILGKSCDRGHRWLVSKSIADCVEAVIGAYYVGGGFVAALHTMKWLGIEAELGPCYVDKAINLASDRSCALKIDQVTALESKLGYEFSTKGLLLEAITHLTEQETGVGVDYSYERLEFLGDAVLDVLITWHLYQNHTDIDPGELTDLRSASVNNENFAQVSVRRDLYQHLQLCSESISKQITDYVTLVTDAEDSKSLQGRQCPKVLGDLFESIAGAILIDTKLNVEEVWRIFLPLLSPIVTPDNLELPPFRELNELCDCLGYFFKEHCINVKDVVFVELRLQLEDILLIGEGIGKTKKAAKGQAALYLLKGLESRGMSYDRCVLKRKKQESHDVSSGLVDMKFSVIKDKPRKKQKVSQLPCGDNGASDASIPVIAAVKAEKGGPRSSLYELCKRLQWPMPSFETTEEKSRSPMEFGQGSDKRTGFNSFTSKISLLIPDSGVMEATGEQRADKKNSQDSAALHLLYQLEKQGKVVINC
ncbi:endoribonuclease Dicer homolog 3 [Spinacia oleracea]|uniref:Endoribonuclease Dicer homolog 3 n=1 Tax=Spinacia oleracea TaxID=3562 RepID=A0A9R0IQD8_SPIOL|nr:endoribonuclease Dicer homolog 3 [Spinacia oleracea]XP_056683959.1 endoribonuclease Dicer homolog 3 [Spinacia oleracea]